MRCKWLGSLVVVSIVFGLTPSASMAIARTSADQMQDWLSEINAAGNLPGNEMLLTRELDKIDNQIESVRAVLGNTQKTDAAIQAAALHRDDTAHQVDVISALNCKSGSQFKDALNSIKSDYAWFREFDMDNEDFHTDSSGLRSLVITAEPDRNVSAEGGEDACNRVKAFITGHPDIKSSIVQIFNAVVAYATSSKQAQETANQLLDKLKQRRGAIQQKMNSQTSQLAISGSLWIIMIVIGAASVGTILVVKLFSETIQLEWVSSGQVIQFVTVMILLSVIMALGLSSILHEDTLGTLLGGVAGYVLAQGVGRAVARDVAKSAGLLSGR